MTSPRRSVIAQPRCLNLVLASAIVLLAGIVDAQTYSVVPDSTVTPKSNAVPSKSVDQALGWGSNIQNARLARAAQQALQNGDHALALEYAQRAAQAAPNDPQLWFLLGYAARLDGKQAQSVDAYSHGLRLSPSSLDGLSGLAQTYSVKGKGDEAIRLLKQVVSSDPKRKEDALLLGELYMRSADYTDAIDWLGRAERMQPGARSELLMALSYQHMKQMDMANRYLKLAKQRDPNNPDVQRTLAGYYREIKSYQEAIDALKSIQNPKPDVIAELAYTYQLDGKLEDAARLYAQAAEDVPKDIGLQLSAAQAEIVLGSIRQANLFLNRAATIDSNYYRLHSIRGEIAKLKGQDQVAVQEYTAALASMPTTSAEGPLFGIQLHMELMNLYRDLEEDSAAQHQLAIAQTQIRELNDHEYDREQFLRLRAMIRMNAGNLPGALEDIQNSLAIDATDRNNLQLDGDILIKLGRTEDAINVYKKILASDPSNRFALTSLGYASHTVGRNKEAETYFLHLAGVDTSLYVPYLALGDIYTAQHEFAKAQVAYSQAYTLDPRKALVLAGGINAAIDAHNLTLAGTWMKRVTSEMQKEPHILRESERYLSLTDQYKESAEVGRKAILVLPQDRDVVVYLGYDLLHLEKYEELLALTTKYLSIFPNEPDIPLLEGYVHKHQGLFAQALQDFTETLRRDPNVVTAYVNRAYMLNDLHQPKAAAEDFDEALKREPGNGEAHLGLAYADMDMHKPQAALRQTELAEHTLGDSRDIHVIRATAYGQEDMLTKAASEYNAALKFTPDDGALQLGLANTFFAERRYHDAIDKLQLAKKNSPENADIYALLARSFANLQDRDQTLKYVQQAEEQAQEAKGVKGNSQTIQSETFLSTGKALSTLGDRRDAMERFSRALAIPGSNRVNIRFAIAQVYAQQGQSEDAERQIALALMEAESGKTVPPTGNEFIAAADVFRMLHEYQLSQTYLQRAKASDAPDTKVRIGMANNYLAMGDSTRAQAQLAAVSVAADGTYDYQYLLAEANVLRQQHQGAQAITSFAQAASVEGEDQTAWQSLLEAGADEGLRVTPKLSILSDFSVDPIFEDTTVYVLDSKLDATFPVPISDTALLPPPRSSLATQWTTAFHLHPAHIPTPSGFFQLTNTQGVISVPSTNSIVSRNTTDYTVNMGINPTVNLGRNVLTFNTGIQTTIRRDSKSPLAMNQNLLRFFAYVTSSSFFNVVSVSGYVIREAGPFTESNLHSVALTGAVDFRVGAPWGKTALITGWGVNDQKFSPVNYEDYYTSSYIGLERKFSTHFDVRALVEDLRAWRVVGTNTGNAQDVRTAGTVDFTPHPNWDLRVATAYSSTRSFHVYDATQNGFSISYARPFHHKFNDDSKEVVLEYPIRFSAGLQEEDFFNFKGGQTQQLRPYVQISVF